MKKGQVHALASQFLETLSRNAKKGVYPNISMEIINIQQKTQSLEKTGKQTCQFFFLLHPLQPLLTPSSSLN